MNINLDVIRRTNPTGVMTLDEYTNIESALIPNGGFATQHAPTIISTSDNKMLCAWFAGTFEGDGDISIVVSKFDPISQVWSTPTVVSQGEDRSEQNPSFFKNPDGSIWLIYTSQESRTEGKDNMQYTSVIMVQKSYDDGETWSDAEVLFDKPGTFGRQAIQILSNGRWIYSTWLCHPGEGGLIEDPTEFQISDDQGKTWTEVLMPESNGRVHANVIEVEEGKLVAFMRSRFADFIYRSDSNDYGSSWSVPEATVLPNNNSSVSAIKLNTNEIAVAYNRNSANNAKFQEINWPGLRNPVAVSVSEDYGKTFPIGRIIEAAEGFIGEENRVNNMQYEYPTLYQDDEGVIHLVYTYKNRVCIKYSRFTIEDLFGEKREKDVVYNPTSGEGIIK